ncbi:MAG: YggT family protein [Gallionella sp.]|nr:YggT family protein [Gallionella sp.]MDD4960242.1 YggT family protein [Gallionella sp.]
MLRELAVLLLDAFVQGFAGLLFFRFLLQWLRAPMRNSAGEFIMALTDWVVLPVRRHIPALHGLDSASLLLAYGVEVLYLGLLLTVEGSGFAFLGLLVLAIVKLMVMAVYLLIVALLVQAVLSWTNPHTPLAPLLNAITQRFLAPIRRIIPLVGSIDLSPLVLLIICQIILIVPIQFLNNLALHLM